jgi:hypothetical protein
LLTEEFVVHFAGISLLVARSLGFEVEFDEIRTETLDLLADFETDIVATNRSAEPFGGRDGLKAGNAGPDHEHFSRLYRPRSRHL